MKDLRLQQEIVHLRRERDEARAALAKLQSEFAELKAYDDIREAAYDAGSKESYRLGYARAFEKVANARAAALEEAASRASHALAAFHAVHIPKYIRALTSSPPTMVCMERRIVRRAIDCLISYGAGGRPYEAAQAVIGIVDAVLGAQ